MTNEFANKLQLKITKIEIPVMGLSNANNNVNTSIISLHKQYKPKETFLFDISTVKIPSNIKLSDTEFNISRPVDMLLGSDIFSNV